MNRLTLFSLALVGAAGRAATPDCATCVCVASTTAAPPYTGPSTVTTTTTTEEASTGPSTTVPSTVPSTAAPTTVPTTVTTAASESTEGQNTAARRRLDVFPEVDDGDVSCSEECAAWVVKNAEADVWDFYEFLNDLGPLCSVKASVDLPIELDEFCAVDKNGWVVGRPEPNASVPEFDAVTTFDGPAQFRVWHKGSAWTCSDEEEVMGGPIKTPVTSCPEELPETSKESAMTVQDSGKASGYVLYTDASNWLATSQVGDQYIIQSESCYGPVSKVDIIMPITTTFYGVSEMPETKAPTSPSGALANIVAPAAALLVSLGAFLTY